MTRSEIRHALFRMKNGSPKAGFESLYETVASMMPPNESWGTFAKNWDIVINNGVVLIVKPEKDYAFVHATCLEYSICVRNGITPNFDHRKMNIIAIVESTMLEGKMTWENYNVDWGLTVDLDRSFIQTHLHKTQVNVVTDEMIASSAKSDGAAMTAVAALPNTEVEMTPQELTPEQKLAFQQFLARRQQK